MKFDNFDFDSILENEAKKAEELPIKVEEVKPRKIIFIIRFLYRDLESNYTTDQIETFTKSIENCTFVNLSFE